MSIIILDSNEESLNRCKGIVEGMELEEDVLYTIYPEQAMEWLSEEIISVFITEIDLEVMSCSEISDMLNILHPESALMLMTEVLNPKATVETLNAGDYFEIILKPLRFNEDLTKPMERAIKEHKKKKAKLEFEIINKKQLDQLKEAKARVNREKKKQKQDFSNICNMIKGISMFNIKHAVKLNIYNEEEKRVCLDFMNRIMIEYMNCFVFYKYSKDEFIMKLKSSFEDTTNGSQIGVKINLNDAVGSHENVKAMFSAYALAELCKTMLGRYKIMVSVDNSEDGIVTKALCDVRFSTIDNTIIYNTDNRVLMEQMYMVVKNILSTTYNKTLMGYKDNPFFIATVMN